MNPVRVCLVTDELHPFTNGGIGRLLHNLIRDSHRRGAPVEFHVVTPLDPRLDPAAVEAYFDRPVRVHPCDFGAHADHPGPVADADGLYPPSPAFTDSEWHAQSVALMRHLKAMERRGLRFDVIEFPDFRGWAFATLQEKHLGVAFQDVCINVRLHSSWGSLMHFEPSTLEAENLGRFELERKALLDADHVVAHLACIRDFNRSYYGFDDAWQSKVTVEFPPVLEDVAVPAEDGKPASPPRDLLFVTRIQPFKRPDLFIRAAAQLMASTPSFEGRAILCCHAFDRHAVDSLKALIPPALAGRFEFVPPGGQRDSLIRRCVVVIPSDYESLNLTAYEASAQGATLVLNGACLAFAAGQGPWRDGVNCHTFDGSLDGLVDAMKRGLAGRPPEKVTPTAERPFWETLPASRRASETTLSREAPLVTVVVANQDEQRYLPELLANLASSTHIELEVLIVDDGSSTPIDPAVSAAALGDEGPESLVRIHHLPVRRGRAAAWNLGARLARGQFVLTLTSRDRVASDFIERALQAFRAERGGGTFAAVVPTVGLYRSEEHLLDRQFEGYQVFLGDCPSFGLLQNRLGGAVALFPRALLIESAFDERWLDAPEWELFLRLVHQGRRLVVTNQVAAFRPLSAVPALEVGSREHAQLASRLFESLPQPLPAGVRLFPLLAVSKEAMWDRLGTFEGRRAEQGEAGDDIPVRYRLADALNRRLKRWDALHPVLRNGASRVRNRLPGTADEGRPLRYELADQLNGFLKRLTPVHGAIKSRAERTTRWLQSED